LPCEVLFEGASVRAFVLDLSATGLFVQTSVRMRPGSDVEVRLQIANVSEPLHLRARVARRRQVPTQLTTIAHGGVGVALDVYHVWWDPEITAQVERAGASRLLAFHICDWLVPTTDLLEDRGMMGDGVADIAGLRRLVEAQGYDGCHEVEIFSLAGGKCEADSMSDPRDASGYSASDLSSMGFIHTPSLAALIEEALLAWREGRLVATDAGILRLDAMLPVLLK